MVVSNFEQCSALRVIFGVLARKLKLTTFSRNWEIRLAFTIVGDKKIFFAYNPWNVAKRHHGKEIFQSMTYITHKSSRRKVFFFVYHKLGSNKNK